MLKATCGPCGCIAPLRASDLREIHPSLQALLHGTHWMLTRKMGEGEQPGQTYLLVHVWVKGTVLSEKHKVPCRSFPYPSWKNTISPLGSRANCMVLRAQDPWQPGEESKCSVLGERGKTTCRPEVSVDGGGTDH